MMALLGISACDGKKGTPPGERVLEVMDLIRNEKLIEIEDYILENDTHGAGFFYSMLSPIFSEKGGVTKIELDSEEINGETASVDVRWHYRNGDSDLKTFTLKYEEKKWKINL